MVDKVIQFFEREVKGLHEAAYVLALFAFLSQLLALVRDRLLAGTFGASELLDVYYAAFKIPDIVFALVSAFVSISVLIPFIVKIVDDKKKTDRFADSVFTAVSIIVVLFSIITFVLARPILSVLFPDIVSGEFGGQLVLMTRIMLLQPIFLSLSSLYSSFLHVYKKFFIYALSPLLYNLGIIIGVVVLYPIMGIQGLAYGVVLGAIMHFAIQVPVVTKKGILPNFTFFPDLKSIKEVLVLSIPRTLALAGSQIINIVMLILAGTMIAGSISIFSLSFNLQSVPLAIIGMSYSLAAFPTLSKLFADGEIKVFTEHILKAARHIIFWSIPVTVMFIVLRAQIVRTILGSGEFTWDDTRLTAAALAIFAISIVAQSLSLLLIRGYYATGETKRPLQYALITIIVTIVSALLMVSLFDSNSEIVRNLESLLKVSGITGTIVLVLPLAYTFGQIVNALLLWISFDVRYKCFSLNLWRTVLHSVLGSIAAGATALLLLRILDDVFNLNTTIGVFMQGFISGIVGLLIGALVLKLIKNKEIDTIFEVARGKLFKKT